MCHCGENQGLGCLQRHVWGVGMQAGSMKAGMMTRSRRKTQEHAYKGPLSCANDWTLSALGNDSSDSQWHRHDGRVTLEYWLWCWSHGSGLVGRVSVRVQQGPDDEGRAGCQEAGRGHLYLLLSAWHPFRVCIRKAESHGQVLRAVLVTCPGHCTIPRALFLFSFPAATFPLCTEGLGHPYLQG